MFIEQPAKWLRWLYPKAIWRMDKKDHSVYLTFDDGPIPESTPFILETLRKYNIKATFFMVGENVLRHHDLYNQIVAEGHQVGNHTFNHIGAFKHRVISYVLNTNKASPSVIISQRQIILPYAGFSLINFTLSSLLRVFGSRIPFLVAMKFSFSSR